MFLKWTKIWTMWLFYCTFFAAFLFLVKFWPKKCSLLTAKLWFTKDQIRLDSYWEVSHSVLRWDSTINIYSIDKKIHFATRIHVDIKRSGHSLFLFHLNNYFRLLVCLPFSASVGMCVCLSYLTILSCITKWH